MVIVGIVVTKIEIEIGGKRAGPGPAWQRWKRHVGPRQAPGDQSWWWMLLERFVLNQHQRSNDDAEVQR